VLDAEIDEHRHKNPTVDAKENDGTGKSRALWGSLDGIGQCTWQLAAKTHSLYEAQKNEQQWGGHTPSFVGWQQPNQDRGRSRGEKRAQKDWSPAVAVTQPTEHDSAERPRDKPER
jgi:hypothetical protein